MSIYDRIDAEFDRASGSLTQARGTRRRPAAKPYSLEVDDKWTTVAPTLNQNVGSQFISDAIARQQVFNNAGRIDAVLRQPGLSPDSRARLTELRAELERGPQPNALQRAGGYVFGFLDEVFTRTTTPVLLGLAELSGLDAGREIGGDDYLAAIRGDKEHFQEKWAGTELGMEDGRIDMDNLFQMAGWSRDNSNPLLRFARTGSTLVSDVVFDPLTYLGFGGSAVSGRLKEAKGMDIFADAAKAVEYRMLGDAALETVDDAAAAAARKMAQTTFGEEFERVTRSHLPKAREKWVDDMMWSAEGEALILEVGERAARDHFTNMALAQLLPDVVRKAIFRAEQEVWQGSVARSIARQYKSIDDSFRALRKEMGHTYMPGWMTGGIRVGDPLGMTGRGWTIPGTEGLARRLTMEPVSAASSWMAGRSAAYAAMEGRYKKILEDWALKKSKWSSNSLTVYNSRLAPIDSFDGVSLSPSRIFAMRTHGADQELRAIFVNQHRKLQGATGELLKAAKAVKHSDMEGLMANVMEYMERAGPNVGAHLPEHLGMKIADNAELEKAAVEWAVTAREIDTDLWRRYKKYNPSVGDIDEYAPHIVTDEAQELLEYLARENPHFPRVDYGSELLALLRDSTAPRVGMPVPGGIPWDRARKTGKTLVNVAPGVGNPATHINLEALGDLAQANHRRGYASARNLNEILGAAISRLAAVDATVNRIAGKQGFEFFETKANVAWMKYIDSMHDSIRTYALIDHYRSWGLVKDADFVTAIDEVLSSLHAWWDEGTTPFFKKMQKILTDTKAAEADVMRKVSIPGVGKYEVPRVVADHPLFKQVADELRVEAKAWRENARKIAHEQKEIRQQLRARGFSHAVADVVATAESERMLRRKVANLVGVARSVRDNYERAVLETFNRLDPAAYAAFRAERADVVMQQIDRMYTEVQSEMTRLVEEYRGLVQAFKDEGTEGAATRAHRLSDSEQRQLTRFLHTEMDEIREQLALQYEAEAAEARVRAAAYGAPETDGALGEQAMWLNMVEMYEMEAQVMRGLPDDVASKIGQTNYAFDNLDAMHTKIAKIKLLEAAGLPDSISSWGDPATVDKAMNWLAREWQRINPEAAAQPIQEVEAVFKGLWDSTQRMADGGEALVEFAYHPAIRELIEAQVRKGNYLPQSEWTDFWRGFKQEEPRAEYQRKAREARAKAEKRRARLYADGWVDEPDVMMTQYVDPPATIRRKNPETGEIEEIPNWNAKGRDAAHSIQVPRTAEYIDSEIRKLEEEALAWEAMAERNMKWTDPGDALALKKARTSGKRGQPPGLNSLKEEFPHIEEMTPTVDIITADILQVHMDVLRHWETKLAQEFEYGPVLFQLNTASIDAGLHGPMTAEFPLKGWLTYPDPKRQQNTLKGSILRKMDHPDGSSTTRYDPSLWDYYSDVLGLPANRRLRPYYDAGHKQWRLSLVDDELMTFDPTLTEAVAARNADLSGQAVNPLMREMMSSPDVIDTVDAYRFLVAALDDWEAEALALARSGSAQQRGLTQRFERLKAVTVEVEDALNRTLRGTTAKDQKALWDLLTTFDKNGAKRLTSTGKFLEVNLPQDAWLRLRGVAEYRAVLADAGTNKILRARIARAHAFHQEAARLFDPEEGARRVQQAIVDARANLQTVSDEHAQGIIALIEAVNDAKNRWGGRTVDGGVTAVITPNKGAIAQDHPEFMRGMERLSEMITQLEERGVISAADARRGRESVSLTQSGAQRRLNDKDGWVRGLDGLGTGALADQEFPKQLLPIFQAYIKEMGNMHAGGFYALMNQVEKFQSWWKPMVTVGRGPSFVLRNVIGGMWNNQVLGVTPADYAWAMKWGMKFRKELRLNHFDIDKALQSMPENVRGLLAEAADQNVLNSFSRTDLHYALRNIAPWNTAKGFRQIINPLSSGSFLVRSGTKMMEASEDFLRLAAYKRGKNLGQSGRVAGGMAVLAHFDYSDLTNLDRAVKKWAPFWIWASRNMELQLKILLERPNLVARYAHVMENVESNFGGGDAENMFGPSGYWSPLAAGTGYGLRNGEPYWARAWYDPDFPVKDLFTVPILFGDGIMEGVGNFVSNALGPGPQLGLELSSDFGQLWNDDGFAPAPFGLKQVGAFLSFTGLFKRYEADGSVVTSQVVRGLYETAFPWIREFIEPVLIPEDKKRAQRLGFAPGDTGPLSRVRALASQLLARPVGVKYSTPADAAPWYMPIVNEAERIERDLKYQGKHVGR